MRKVPTCSVNDPHTCCPNMGLDLVFFLATATCPLEKTCFAPLYATALTKNLHHLSWTDVHQKATIPNGTKNK